jgi:hypothetical protein
MRPVVRDSHRAQTSVHASRLSLGAGNGTRTRDVQLGRLTLYQLSYSRILYLGHHFGTVWWRGEDSNLRRLSQQIYSLPPLAAREPLPLGAGDGTRTRNLLITNQLLYRLSYASKRLLYKTIFFNTPKIRCQGDSTFASPDPIDHRNDSRKKKIAVHNPFKGNAVYQVPLPVDHEKTPEHQCINNQPEADGGHYTRGCRHR